MDSNGFYSGWQDFVVTVRPSLVHRFTLAISGARGDLADHIAESYSQALAEMVNPAELHIEAGNMPAPEVTSAEPESAL